MDSLRAWIDARFAPAIYVASAPAAEAICVSKNGLSIVDVLRPFSQIVGLNGEGDLGSPAMLLAQQDTPGDTIPSFPCSCCACCGCCHQAPRDAGPLPCRWHLPPAEAGGRIDGMHSELSSYLRAAGRCKHADWGGLGCEGGVWRWGTYRYTMCVQACMRVQCAHTRACAYTHVHYNGIMGATHTRTHAHTLPARPDEEHPRSVFQTAAQRSVRACEQARARTHPHTHT